MQYNGKKDIVEMFNDTWKVNHQGKIPGENKTNNNNSMPFKMNGPNTNIQRPNNNMKKPMGYNGRNSGLNGQL